MSSFTKGFEGWERSGLVGAGDVRALLALQRKWTTLGDVDFRAESSERLVSSGNLRDNLVCIGGPDANPVTRLVLERTLTTLSVPEGTVAFADAESGTYFNPSAGRDGNRRDLGIIVRTQNPFNPERAALVLAGSFGDGTEGAADLVCTDRFERSFVATVHPAFEVLLEVEVIRGSPQSPKVVIQRALPEPT